MAHQPATAVPRPRVDLGAPIREPTRGCVLAENRVDMPQHRGHPNSVKASMKWLRSSSVKRADCGDTAAVPAQRRLRLPDVSGDEPAARSGCAALNSTFSVTRCDRRVLCEGVCL